MHSSFNAFLCFIFSQDLPLAATTSMSLSDSFMHNFYSVFHIPVRHWYSCIYFIKLILAICKLPVTTLYASYKPHICIFFPSVVLLNLDYLLRILKYKSLNNYLHLSTWPLLSRVKLEEDVPGPLLCSLYPESHWIFSS